MPIPFRGYEKRVQCQSMEELYAVVYSSQSTGSIEEHAKLAHEIERQSLENNQAVGVSGILLFRDGLFLQWLEGPKNEVSSIMQRIVQDPRHESIHQVFEGPITQRKYPHWSMKAVQSTHTERDILKSFLQDIKDANSAKDENMARQVLNIFEAYESKIKAPLN